MTNEEAYEVCEERYENWDAFTMGQKEQIVAGYKQDLTDEQVGTYAKTNLDREQMQEIRWGLQDGLTIEQAEEVAGSGLSAKGGKSKMFRMILTMLKESKKENA